jgi:signal peptidase
MRLAARFLMLGLLVALLGVVGLAAIPHLRGLDTTVAMGGSMEPLISRGSLVIAKRLGPAAVEAGDVIVYIRGTDPGVRVTHRVVSVLETDEGPVLQTKGDANRSIDPQLLTFDQPVSRVEFSVPYVGYVISLARTVTGKILLIGLPIVLFVVLRMRERSRATLVRGVAVAAATSLPAHLSPLRRDPRQAALIRE